MSAPAPIILFMQKLGLKNKRILIVIACFHPTIGGMEIATKRLSAYLKEVGFDVCVLTKQVLPKLPTSDFVDNIQIVRVEKNILGFTTGIVRLTNKYDVLLFAGQLTNSSKLRFNLMLALILIARILGKKVIFWSSSGVKRYKFLFGGTFNPAKFLVRFVNKIVCLGDEQMAFFGQKAVNKPTVIIQTPWAYPREGGIPTASRNVAKKLAELGISPIILTRKHDSSLQNMECIDGVRIQRTGCNIVLAQISLVACVVSNFKNLKSLLIWGDFNTPISNIQLLTGKMLIFSGKGFYVRCSNAKGLDH